MRKRTIEIVPETKPQFVTVNEDEVARVMEAFSACGFAICNEGDINPDHVLAQSQILDRILDGE